MLKKNDIIELNITDTTNLGAGVGHIDGIAVLVQRAVKGDVAKVRIIKAEKTYYVGKIEELLRPSEHRSSDKNGGCSVFGRCGGCVFRHVSHSYELELKREHVASCMKKSGVDISVSPVVSNCRTEGYRNKIQYPIGGHGVGYYAQKSHTVITCDGHCPQHDRAFDSIIDTVTSFISEFGISHYDELTGKGLLRHLYLRCTSAEPKSVMVCLVINGDHLPKSDILVSRLTSDPQVSGIMLCHNKKNTNVILDDKFTLLWGREDIVDTLCGMKFKISPRSFYQVNHDVAELLYKKALELAELQAGDKLVDLFCGTGTIGLYMKKNSSAARLVGVEIIEAAVENARENARVNDVDGAEFYCGDANSPEISEADVIVIDPPRKGCDKELIEKICQIAPRRVVYISCDPATLARDLAEFAKQGYRGETVTPFDLFPGTSHVESVVLLSRKDVYERIKFDVNVEDLQGRASSTATYSEIKAYILEKYGLNVSSLHIAQIKDKCGFEKRDNYNIGEGKSKELICPPEKEQAIMDAFKHFGMLQE